MLLRSTCLLFVLLLVQPLLKAQTMAEAMNNKCDILWIGLDFSEAQFVPAVEFADVQANVDLALLRWNNLLEQEPTKFDLGFALGSTRCTSNTSYVQEVNTGLDPNELLQRTASPWDKSKIPDMVKRYKTTSEGVGVVFIVEVFDKAQVTAVFHVTFFNMASNEVLFTERIMGSPSGFGIRNYWAGAVYHVLKNIKKTYSLAWHARFK